MSAARSASHLRSSAPLRFTPAPRLCTCPCRHRAYATHRDTKGIRPDKVPDLKSRKEEHSKPTINQNALLRDTAPAQPSRDGPQTTDSRSSSRLPPEPMDRNEDAMNQKRNPVPSKTAALEVKSVIRSVKRRGRLSRQEVIARTEREGLYKSDYWKTSMKKLAPLARQIAGKTLDQAIVQMEFSKKKNAVFIADFLEKAKVTAHVERGMGLGDNSEAKRLRVADERQRAGLPPLQEPKKSEQAAATASDPQVFAPGVELPETTIDEALLGPGESIVQDQERKPGGDEADRNRKDGPARDGARKVLLKGKTPHMVYDSTTMYISQAWVNKGSYGADSMKRARGRIDKLMLPQTSISVVIKEEATRLREDADRQAKEAKKKVWVQLPDRPVSAQRPYYCW